MHAIGKSAPRQDGHEKVRGLAEYTNDLESARQLHAAFVTSPYAHAVIRNIDTSLALQVPGVAAIVTGEMCPVLTGPIVADRPPIAVGKVRYFGEVVAVVVADTEQHAMLAAGRVMVEYGALPVVNSPLEAFRDDAPLLHENLGSYKIYGEAHPVPGTNIANHVKIRKGDMQQGWAMSDVVVEETFAFNTADHAAMEPRCAICEVLGDDRVRIWTSSQTPYGVREYFDRYFPVTAGKVEVTTPLVGGAFGGKSAVQLEYIAYLCSLAVGGRPVKVNNQRENDMVTSPCHLGLEARVKMGATRDGKITAAEISYWFDGGGYSDMAVIVTKAAASDCTGPYAIENVHCDTYCMYTNHPYTASFRGFGHPELHFCIERTVEILAKRLNFDPLDLRLMNAVRPGDTSPTQAELTRSNLGDLPACIEKLKALVRWNEEPRIVISGNKVRVKGVSCIWKASSTDKNATAGAVITFNEDGSCNVMTGGVEIGQGTKTVIAQIVAERLKMDISKVHSSIEVRTREAPKHWKTVASSTTFMVGRAAIEAADDAAAQLKRTAAIVLRVLVEDLEVGYGRVYVRDNPSLYVEIKDVAMGYEYPNGNSIEGQVIGRGNYIVRRLTNLDPETGAGKPGIEWTVAAKAVEVEVDLRECTYRLLRAWCVIDAGKVLNPALATGQIMGGMSMGLSFASREGFVFDELGRVLNTQFRSYKLIHFGEQPEYIVDFVETPQEDAPYGARGIGEFGVIGMPGALANALSIAAGVELKQLPLVPEYIWRLRKGEQA